MNLYVEIFGYFGTALVIVSMLMTSIVRLRIVNICGSVISAIYATLGNAWPIVTLNLCLIGINLFQLIRSARQRGDVGCIKIATDNPIAAYFLSIHQKDIERYFPTYQLTVTENYEAYLALVGSETVGLLVGERARDRFSVELVYVVPKYRHAAIESLLFSHLQKDGVRFLAAQAEAKEQRAYLRKIGFEEQGDRMLKMLSKGD